MPIIFKDGMAYIKTLGRPNDQGLETYPHVFFTSPVTWEPSLLDHEFSPEHEITWSQLQDTRPFYDALFDAQGNLNQRIIATLTTFLDLPDHNDKSTFNINSTSWHSLPHHSLPSDVDWEALKPYFGWAPISSIQNTFKVTTKYGPAAATLTISRSISNPEIMSSTSLGEMKLLPLTQSSLILQPLLMDPQWSNFSVEERHFGL